jgi:hypothetical protein
MAITCLVTIHGIGFQRAPNPPDDPIGYADPLHDHLSEYLTPQVLSDDPNRSRSRPGEDGAIYVQSHYPSIEAGLKRLGVWNADRSAIVFDATSKLVAGTEPISHVALVYAHPENQAFQHVGSALEAAINATSSQARYGSIFGVGGMLVSDALAPLNRPTTANCVEPPGQSLRPRTSTSPNSLPPDHRLFGLRLPWPAPVAASSGGNDGGVIRALEEDVTTYVFRNDLRAGVRDFIREALLRLARRDDVGNIVVNSHSQGTVAAFDAIRDLAPADAARIGHFVTSGSPLRKYVDLFYWGDEVRNVGVTRAWTNFFDRYDPVSDALSMKEWRPGWSLADSPPQTDTLFRYQAPDAGDPTAYQLTDVEVDNLGNSCGAVRAHNYWDNRAEWVPAVAKILKGLI